jgi:hypothetical protein
MFSIYFDSAFGLLQCVDMGNGANRRYTLLPFSDSKCVGWCLCLYSTNNGKTRVRRIVEFIYVNFIKCCQMTQNICLYVLVVSDRAIE